MNPGTDSGVPPTPYWPKHGLDPPYSLGHPISFARQSRGHRGGALPGCGCSAGRRLNQHRDGVPIGTLNFDRDSPGGLGRVGPGCTLITRDAFCKRTDAFDPDRRLLGLLAYSFGPAQNVRRRFVRKRVFECHVIVVIVMRDQRRDATTAGQDKSQEECAQRHSVKVASANQTKERLYYPDRVRGPPPRCRTPPRAEACGGAPQPLLKFGGRSSP